MSALLRSSRSRSKTAPDTAISAASNSMLPPASSNWFISFGEKVKLLSRRELWYKVSAPIDLLQNLARGPYIFTHFFTNCSIC